MKTIFGGCSSIEKHEQKSKNAIKAFQDTVEKLSFGNLAIDDDISKEDQLIVAKQKEIEEAEGRKKLLTVIKDKNLKWVNKINGFFELG